MSVYHMILFWGITEQYGLFSNFYPCLFKDEEGVTYTCSEQYFMIQKLKTFDPDNHVLYSQMLREKNPKTVKQYGRQIKIIMIANGIK